MRRVVYIWAACAALLASAGACGDEIENPARNADEVLVRWNNAGLDVGVHKGLEKHQLGKAVCRRGEVAGVETTLCLYATDEAAKGARSAGLDLVGKTTGAALPRGKMLLVVADRTKADPEGKTINKITKTFLGR